jgi:hypothetical protein
VFVFDFSPGVNAARSGAASTERSKKLLSTKVAPAVVYPKQGAIFSCYDLC